VTQATIPTMTEHIDVDVPPSTAFAVFTDELDQWWGNGPIDAWDSARVVGRRIEPGVGGRLLELYTDDELELGRVTVWEPGVRLAWTSSVDDVAIEVAFEPLDGERTRVRVTGTATGPRAGEGFAFVRMTPQWLPRHLARRAAGRPRPALGPLHVVLRYERPAATGRWLAGAFGFEPTGDIPDREPDPEQTWIELRLGDGSAAVILWPLEAGATVSAADHLPWVFVDDLDAHLAHAEAAGATIVAPVVQHGFRSYTAADCEGRHWVFAQAPPPRRGGVADAPSA
jgi:uncharacterized glyoxalase superfamily protein PhnB